jgi:TonB family protein
MKKYILLVLCIAGLFSSLSAQRRNTYFINKNGEFVRKIDSAETIRIVEAPKDGSALYLTKEYYKSQKLKSGGYSSSINPPVYEGKFLSFFENGKKRQSITYREGRIVDTLLSYFPNGNLYTEQIYVGPADSIKIYLTTVKDSTGKDLVKNGNGDAVIYDKDFTYISGHGKVKDGRYDGEWQGELRTSDILIYKEVYAGGTLLSGESHDHSGNVYHYTQSETLPSFKGGVKEFYKYLSRTVRYPRNAMFSGIQGKVLVGFVILSNGKPDKLHVVNDSDPELAQEAMRVIRTSPLWEPGLQKGRKVNVAFVVPISFSLGR